MYLSCQPKFNSGLLPALMTDHAYYTLTASTRLLGDCRLQPERQAVSLPYLTAIFTLPACSAKQLPGQHGLSAHHMQLTMGACHSQYAMPSGLHISTLHATHIARFCISEGVRAAGIITRKLWGQA